MSPIPKKLHIARAEEEDEDFESASVPISPLDKEDVLVKIYNRLKSMLRDPFLEPDHIASAVKKALRFGAESTDMSVVDFRDKLHQFVRVSTPTYDRNAILTALENATAQEDGGIRSAPPEKEVDDLAGREVVKISRGKKKGSSKEQLSFVINKDVTIAPKTIHRTKDPNGGSFTVINFKRLTPDKPKAKPFEFNCYENLTPDILEAVCFLMATMEQSPPLTTLPALEHVKSEVEEGEGGKTRKKFDLRSFTEPTFTGVSCEVGSDIKVFVAVKMGEYQLIIRKYKNVETLKRGENPTFEFNIPATAMKTLAIALRYYIAARGLGPCMPILENTTLHIYKDCDIVREVMCSTLTLDSVSAVKDKEKQEEEEEVGERKKLKRRVDAAEISIGDGGDEDKEEEEEEKDDDDEIRATSFKKRLRRAME